jgi:hypothetical protein
MGLRLIARLLSRGGTLLDRSRDPARLRTTLMTRWPDCHTASTKASPRRRPSRCRLRIWTAPMSVGCPGRLRKARGGDRASTPAGPPAPDQKGGATPLRTPRECFGLE